MIGRLINRFTEINKTLGNFMTMWVHQIGSALLILGLSLLPSAINAQSADSLKIVGPELENCVLTVRYFKARQISKVVALKITLLNGEIEEPIEMEFDGVQVFLQAQAAPVTISLRSNGVELSQETLNEPGSTNLSAGKIGKIEFTPESIELTESDQAILDSYVVSLNEGTSTVKIVRDTADAAIDFPCLDVFNRELRQRIGAIDLTKSNQSFVAWDEGSNKRTVAGVLHGETGICGIRLVATDGKLVDLQPNCPKLVDDYFREPLETGVYVSRAEQLTRLLFAGDGAKAHQLYAPQFQEQVKIEQLDKLCETLSERYGQTISAVELKRTQLLDYNFAQRGRVFQVDLLLTLEKEIRCMARVTYSIPSDRTRVGKGGLAGINVNQVFQSAHPQLAKRTQVLLQQLGKPLQLEHLMGILHPELKPSIDKDQVQALLNRLGNQFKDKEPRYDFDLWTVSQFQGFVQASGPLKYDDRDCYLEIHFVDEQLIGFSFYGPALAESTLELLRFSPSIADNAKLFWTHLLKDEAESAHAMLDKDFQTQFSLEDLKKQLEEPESRPSKLKEVQVDNVRLCSQVSRPSALMATVYLTATFEDGDVQAVACDMAIPQADGTATIYDFTNDFETDFPVTAIPMLDAKAEGGNLAIEAFKTKDPQKLLALIEPSRKEIIDAATLRAYFENFGEIAGELGEPLSAARTVEYQRAGKRYRLNFFFKISTGEELPMEVWFNGGFIERFVVSHPKINDFALKIKDKSGIKKRVESFVQAWFRDANESLSLMITALHTEATLGALNSMKNEFEQGNGKLSKVIIGSESAGEGAGEIEFTVTLEGESGSRDAAILVDVGAFGGMVSAVSLK